MDIARQTFDGREYFKYSSASGPYVQPKLNELLQHAKEQAIKVDNDEQQQKPAAAIEMSDFNADMAAGNDLLNEPNNNNDDQPYDEPADDPYALNDNDNMDDGNYDAEKAAFINQDEARRSGNNIYDLNFLT